MPRTRKTFAAVIAAAALAAGGAAAAVVGLTDGGSAKTVTVLEPSGGTQVANVSNDLTVGQIAQRYGKSVVEIVATQSSSQSTPYPFGGGGGSGSSEAEGTGWVYDTSGHIVTNEHVIDGASTIRVTFQDGSSYKATVVGSDVSSDLAVLKVDAPSSKLSPLTLGDSSAVTVGEGVVAIGDPYGLTGTVTSGIVSAVGREIQAPDGTPIEDAIQTDAAINHGNSGGPLFDLQGHVIGITSQIESDSGVNDGVGFAIPSNTIKSIVPQLLTGQPVEHAFLGVAPATALNAGGVALSKVEPGSGAAKAGLKVGDVIVAIDGKPTKTSDALRAAIDAHKPGDTITLTIHRGDQTKTLTAKLGTRPSS